jgi:hypothetical protein
MPRSRRVKLAECVIKIARYARTPLALVEAAVLEHDTELFRVLCTWSDQATCMETLMKHHASDPVRGINMLKLRVPYWVHYTTIVGSYVDALYREFGKHVIRALLKYEMPLELAAEVLAACKASSCVTRVMTGGQYSTSYHLGVLSEALAIVGDADAFGSLRELLADSVRRADMHVFAAMTAKWVVIEIPSLTLWKRQQSW